MTSKTGGASVASPSPAPRVLDYRNGWYHTADGTENVVSVAAHYQRDAVLVAQLNRTKPQARPARGTMLYIPPANDPAKVREVLVKIAKQPDLVPRVPYDRIHKQADPQVKAVVKNKTPDRGLKKPLPGLRTIVEDAKPQDARPAEIQVASAEPIGLPRRARASGKAKPAPAPAVQPAGLDTAPKPAPSQTAPAPAKPGDAKQFQWPAQGKLTAKFKDGWRQACHGIEIAVPEGAPVQAARAGKVLLAQDFPGYGKMILIDHGDGFASVYAYNREILVKENQPVAQGERIASVGRPSRGGGSKLFFQIRRNAQPVDPLNYLN